MTDTISREMKETRNFSNGAKLRNAPNQLDSISETLRKLEERLTKFDQESLSNRSMNYDVTSGNHHEPPLTLYRSARSDKDNKVVPVEVNEMSYATIIGEKGRNFQSSGGSVSNRSIHNNFDKFEQQPYYARNGLSRNSSESLSSYRSSSSSNFSSSPSTSPSYGKPPMNPSFKHFGSSLTLSDSADIGEIKTRSLRPPTPAVLQLGRTSFSDYSSPSDLRRSRSTIRSLHDQHDQSTPILPDTEPIRGRYTPLQKYLESPRLVSTLHCVERSPSPNSSLGGGFGTRSSFPLVRNNDSGEENNEPRLRFGNFLDSATGNLKDETEIVPQKLRQYYVDTYFQRGGRTWTNLTP